MSSALKWLAGGWADTLGPAISGMSGEACRAEAREDTAAPITATGAYIWEQPFDVSGDAAAWVWLPEPVWREIGERVLKAAGIEDAEPGELQGTFHEVLLQSLAPLTNALTARFGKEIRTAPGRKLEMVPEAPGWRAIEIVQAGRTLGIARIAVNSAMAEALEATEPKEGPAEPEPAGQAGGRPRNSKTLELLMEVELPVGVSFGRTHMRLKDAIKLTTGSIVELNRSVNEPVEIIVNNCVVARGDVVVVEGNYGVRIRQIISREERLRTLF
jgi:flagellar motor switch protein FliN/FliY